MGQTFSSRGWQDRTVRVSRKELLNVLRKNRGQHIQDYNVACSGYRERAIVEIDQAIIKLKKQLDQVSANKKTVVSVMVSLPTPVSHESSYDQIIRMMEMSVDDAVELTASQFACFVMDDWEWRQDWETSNAPYFGGMRAQWSKE